MNCLVRKLIKELYKKKEKEKIESTNLNLKAHSIIGK